MFDPWPDEPDEDVPESRWGNPERDLPRIPEQTIPAVSTPESEVEPHLFKTFWASVVFTNVAVFGVSLGAMLWYFRGQALLGGGLLVVGLLAGARTYASYRSFRREKREAQANETHPADDEESDADDEESDADDEESDADDEESDADEESGPVESGDPALDSDSGVAGTDSGESDERDR